MGERGEARAELIDFTIERQRHRRFVGREDVLAQLDEWLLGPGEAGWVVVTGGPGMGKSAVLSTWLARRKAAGAVVPHHFIRRQVVDWDQPERIAASLAAQIEALFPEQRDPEAKPEGRLIELLGRVSKRLGPSGDLVVLVDGLDETRAEPGDNPLPRFLPHEVPRRSEPLRHPAEQLDQPSLGLRRRIAQLREHRLDLRRERRGDPLGLVPVDDLAADEVMRHHGARGLAARQPRRQDGALAHPRAAGDHDPSGLAGTEQPRVELRQHVLAPDEPAVSLPLDREVDQLRPRRR